MWCLAFNKQCTNLNLLRIYIYLIFSSLILRQFTLSIQGVYFIEIIFIDSLSLRLKQLALVYD